MGSVDQEPAFVIPTVDISPYLSDPDSPQAKEVVAQIKDACITSGFFQILGHGISRDLQDAIFNSAKLLFSLSQEEKESLRGASGRGYEVIGAQTLQEGAKPDMKEGYFVGPEAIVSHPPYRDFQHPNVWPSESLIPSSKFKSPLLTYRRNLCDLSTQIMQILAEGLPDTTDRNIFTPFCTNPLAVVRLLHYPPQPDTTDPNLLGAGAHTDFGAITLLLQDTQSGLQVLNKSTNEWIDVPPNRDAYVVNVGDMLDKWTGGRYKSNIHRVINRGGEHRYSVPFFFDGNLDYVLRPLDGRSDEGDEGDGKGETVEEFMRERYRRTYKS